MHFDIITLFPEMFAALDSSIPGRAQKKNLISLKCWNPRDYTEDKYHKVDDVFLWWWSWDGYVI